MSKHAASDKLQVYASLMTIAIIALFVGYSIFIAYWVARLAFD